MSARPKAEKETLLKRVPVIIRSWDGPNSRVGIEMDLGQMPWGPFDALGKHLSLLLPADADAGKSASDSESQVDRALRHVEHAADRCAEFAQLANDDQELWLRSQKTWEWIRKYLTSLWVETEIEGRDPPLGTEAPASPPPSSSLPSEGPPREADLQEAHPLETPLLPGAAATLRVAARALRAIPLNAWRETTGSSDPDATTREEAVQTLLGVARILSRDARSEEIRGEGQPATGTPGSAGPEAVQVPHGDAQASVSQAASSPEERASPGSEASDPDVVSFDFAQGYDEGYRMGRRVGLALGAVKNRGASRGSD
jgi:hypothetical protein